MSAILFAMVGMARFYSNTAPAHRWWVEEEERRLLKQGWRRSCWPL